jgi:hypothetical protein
MGGRMSALGRCGLKKRRPPEGGLSLGRKRPKEGMCDVSHRSNIALQRSKSKRIFSWHASHAQMRGVISARLHGRNAPIPDKCAEDKKEAAQRRPESREETPKEGIRGNAAHCLMWRQGLQMQELNRILVQVD